MNLDLAYCFTFQNYTQKFLNHKFVLLQWTKEGSIFSWILRRKILNLPLTKNTVLFLINLVFKCSRRNSWTRSDKNILYLCEIASFKQPCFKKGIGKIVSWYSSLPPALSCHSILRIGNYPGICFLGLLENHGYFEGSWDAVSDAICILPVRVLQYQLVVVCATCPICFSLAGRPTNKKKKWFGGSW